MDFFNTRSKIKFVTAPLFSFRDAKSWHAIALYLLFRTSLGRRPFDPRGVTQLIRLRRDLRFGVYADKRRTHVNPVCERPRKPEKCRDGLFSPSPLMPPDLRVYFAFHVVYHAAAFSPVLSLSRLPSPPRARLSSPVEN